MAFEQKELNHSVESFLNCFPCVYANFHLVLIVQDFIYALNYKMTFYCFCNLFYQTVWELSGSNICSQVFNFFLRKQFWLNARMNKAVIPVVFRFYFRIDLQDWKVYSWKVYVLPELSIVKLSKTYFFSKVNYCFSVIENNLENYRNEGGVNVFLRVWSILGSCYFSKDSFNKLDWSFNP